MKLSKETKNVIDSLLMLQLYHRNPVFPAEVIKRAQHELAEVTSKAIPCGCAGWGCTSCCSSEQEIRAKQGIFS